MSSPKNPWKCGSYTSSLPSFLSTGPTWNPWPYAQPLTIRSLGIGNLHRHPKSSYVTRIYPTKNLIDNMKRHGFFLPLPHAHNLFTQFNLTLALPNSLSSPLPPFPTLSCPRLHQMIFTAKYVRVRLTNIRCFFVTYVTQYGIWTAFSHPLLPSHMEPGNVPYASRATSYSRQQHDTFAFLPLFSISTLIKIQWY